MSTLGICKCCSGAVSDEAQICPHCGQPDPYQPVSVESSVSVDYSQLEELLAAGKWKEADEQTQVKILEALGKDNWLSVEKEDIENCPREPLRTIDQLWVKYSNGRFGFSVQRKIWLEMGGQVDYETEKKLGLSLGWRKENDWLSYDSLIFDLSLAPEGHLPWSGGYWVALLLLFLSRAQSYET